ncbi:MAG: hypothetical protein IPK68_21090 [Bdellovibrionales bacterium]|nr:hypothetical protein [Bdellovibrionales bacterium]
MTFEESTISQWLYIQLKDKVDNLLICNPTYVGKKAGEPRRTFVMPFIAQELRTNHFAGGISRHQSLDGDPHHGEWILGYCGRNCQIQNRLKAVFRAEAIQTM